MVYQSHGSIIAFSVHITTEEGRREWRIDLLAYLSLRRDDKDRLTEKMIKDRRSLLEWAFKMVSLPIDAFVAVKLRDLANVEGLDQR